MFWKILKWIALLAAGAVGLMVLIPLVLVVIMVWPGADERSPRPDAELIGIFQEHRGEFETLKRMIQEDSLGWVTPAPNASHDSSRSLSPERRAEYDRRMEHLELWEGVFSCGRDCMEFRSTRMGKNLFATLITKGYVFGSWKPCQRYYPELDDLSLERGKSCRNIGDGWALIYEVL